MKFLIFVNDLDNGIMNSLLKFADDTKIYGRVQNVNDRLLLQQDLDKLCHWSKLPKIGKWNSILINVKLCIWAKETKYEYYMNGQELEVVQKEKDLGILLY